jgi:WxcM-like, C-terminal
VSARDIATKSRLILLPRIRDPRGSLTFIEGDNHVPFAIERVSWICGLAGDGAAAGQAHRELEEFVVAVAGRFELVVDDGREVETVALSSTDEGLYVPALHWRTLQSFSADAVCLVLASRPFDAADQISDRDEFLALAS